MLQYQLSSTITCKKEKERQSQNHGKSVTLSRDNKCKLPHLTGWLYARSARRNFFPTITSNSWLLKVSQYDMNVWVFLVGVARVRGGAGALRCCCSFFCVFPFFGVGPFCFLSFFYFMFFFFFSFFFCLFSLFFHFHFFHFFMFSVFFTFFSLFLLEIACTGPPFFSQAVNENRR